MELVTLLKNKKVAVDIDVWTETDWLDKQARNVLNNEKIEDPKESKTACTKL